MSVSVQGMELNKVLIFLLSVTQSIRLVYNINIQVYSTNQYSMGLYPSFIVFRNTLKNIMLTCFLCCSNQFSYQAHEEIKYEVLKGVSTHPFSLTLLC